MRPVGHAPAERGGSPVVGLSVDRQDVGWLNTAFRSQEERLFGPVAKEDLFSNCLVVLALGLSGRHRLTAIGNACRVKFYRSLPFRPRVV